MYCVYRRDLAKLNIVSLQVCNDGRAANRTGSTRRKHVVWRGLCRPLAAERETGQDGPIRVALDLGIWAMGLEKGLFTMPTVFAFGNANGDATHKRKMLAGELR